MGVQVPFTAIFKVIPERAFGRRFEYIRSLQRLAVSVYDALVDVDGLTIAAPGGGQWSSTDYRSDLQFGTAVKPQFGEVPAQLTVEGFYDVDVGDAQPADDITIIHANAWVSGAHNYQLASNAGTAVQLVPPRTAVLTEVKALRTAMTTAIVTALPAADIPLFRLHYKGLVFGDRGLHFPR